MYITDDYDDKDFRERIKGQINNGMFYYEYPNDKESLNWLEFDTTIATRFHKVFEMTQEERDSFDIVIVDYGIMGGTFRDRSEEKERLRLLQEFKADKKKLIWGGAITHYIPASVKREFPKHKFLHNLPIVGLEPDDIKSTLYKIYEGEKPK
ncbi:MAG: hypothetical protein AMQ74_01737 [Candidatus Methanofastidiosum methylothiophilum]|uniref:Uncharacterized protein n=1 Tax=Candidatus Methanofastidiosum methylothiophilum TaxID=1705564 RepID=A0A150IPC7_9EURY|nr:MAG: hypothetical protein AMQ74_01737 [Candidatus Methanofastidiosum methylthiophilus]